MQRIDHVKVFVFENNYIFIPAKIEFLEIKCTHAHTSFHSYLFYNSSNFTSLLSV
jgi:hypothetical protein